MKNFFTCCLLLLLPATASFAQTLADRQAILSILARQTADWNRGDIPAFMRGYWESDSLLYIGKSGLRKGYRTTLENYKKSYPDRTAMGTLDFSILKVEFLGETAALVVGRWHLTRSGGSTPGAKQGDVGGHFSLTWRKIKGQWVIVADHSS